MDKTIREIIEEAAMKALEQYGVRLHKVKIEWFVAMKMGGDEFSKVESVSIEGDGVQRASSKVGE